MAAASSADVIADCELFLPGGGSKPLSAFAADALLVVFLRHLL